MFDMDVYMPANGMASRDNQQSESGKLNTWPALPVTKVTARYPGQDGFLGYHLRVHT